MNKLELRQLIREILLEGDQKSNLQQLQKQIKTQLKLNTSNIEKEGDPDEPWSGGYVLGVENNGETFDIFTNKDGSFSLDDGTKKSLRFKTVDDLKKIIKTGSGSQSNKLIQPSKEELESNVRKLKFDPIDDEFIDDNYKNYNSSKVIPYNKWIKNPSMVAKWKKSDRNPFKGK